MSSLANIASAEMRIGGFQDVTKQMSSTIDQAKQRLQDAVQAADDHKKEASKAQKAYEKASGNVSKAAGDLQKATTDEARAKAQTQLTTAQEAKSSASYKYREARGQMKNDVIVLKNLQAQLDQLVKTALPQLEQQSKIEAQGKKQAKDAAQAGNNAVKEMTKQYSEQLKEVNKAVASSSKALTDTAPNNVSHKGDEQLEDGQATAKDITESFKDPEGEGSKANAAYVKNPSVENPPHIALLDAAAQAKTATADAQAGATDAKKQTAGAAGADPTSSYKAGNEQVPSAKLSVKVPSTGLTAGSLDGEPPQTGPAVSGAPTTGSMPTPQAAAPNGSATPSSTGTAPHAGADPSLYAMPAAAASATGPAQATPARGAAGASAPANTPSATLGTPEAGTTGQAQATRGDGTDNRVSFKLDNSQPQAKAAGESSAVSAGASSGTQDVSVKLPNGNTAKLQFDPSKETLKISDGKAAQGAITVPMTQQQFPKLVSASQHPGVQASAGNLVALAKKDPTAFAAVLNTPQMKAQSGETVVPVAGRSSGAQSSAGSPLATSVSSASTSTSKAAGASSAPSTTDAASTSGATSAPATTSSDASGTPKGASGSGNEERLKKEFWGQFNQDILDSLLKTKKDDDGKSGGGGSKAGGKSKAGAGAAGAPAAVVGGGGATAGAGAAPEVMGLNAATSSKSMLAAAPTTTTPEATTSNTATATDANGGGNASTSDGSSSNSGETQSTEERADYPDINAQYASLNTVSLTGMELVQAVLLIAAQQSQAEVRDMALQVQDKTKTKSDLRADLTKQRDLMNSMQQADAKGTGNTWFAADNKGMTDAAASINKKMGEDDQQIQTLGDDNQLLFIKLQNLSQQLTQTMQAASSVSKSLFDTSKAIIGNIGH